jgi:hypothetical protein
MPAAPDVRSKKWSLKPRAGIRLISEGQITVRGAMPPKKIPRPLRREQAPPANARGIFWYSLPGHNFKQE